MEHRAPVVKRAMVLYFRCGLQNLKRILAILLRIARKPSLFQGGRSHQARQRCQQHSLTVVAAGTAALGQQRERLCPTLAFLCAARRRRRWHGMARNIELSNALRRVPARIAPALLASGPSCACSVCRRAPHRQRSNNTRRRRREMNAARSRGEALEPCPSRAPLPERRRPCAT